MNNRIIYHPLTATPNQKKVIPDTCMDIIYHIDYTNDTVTGGFCGINDCSFHTHSSGTIGHMVSTFAVRFYAWSAYTFADDSLQSTMNGYFDVGSRFEWLDTHDDLLHNAFKDHSIKPLQNIAVGKYFFKGCHTLTRILLIGNISLQNLNVFLGLPDFHRKVLIPFIVCFLGNPFVQIIQVGKLLTTLFRILQSLLFLL